MKAAVLKSYGERLVITDVPEPDLPVGGALVRVGGAGVCHTDVHLSKGEYREMLPLTLPHVLGHEIAGYVEAVDDRADGPAPGSPVIIYGAEHCGTCFQCRRGATQLCGGSWLGVSAGAAGGYAELVSVPKAGMLIPLEGIDPVEAAVLGDAAGTSYRAVKWIADRCGPDATLVVVGLGGLGQYAVQLARLLTSARIVVCVRRAEDKAELALGLGAHEVVDLLDKHAVTATRELCEHGGADAVIDLVTVDSTIAFARDVLVPGGLHVSAGLGHGTIPFGWDSVPLESVHMSTFWASYRDLCEVLSLHKRGLLRSSIHTRPLEDINDVLDEIAASKVTGRTVLVP